MKTISSFTVDHTKLLSGVYVSRRDTKNGMTVTTFDLRITAPNREPVIDMPAIHTIEHLGATFLRNCPSKEDIIYFGPMGCRTGFYLVMFGELDPDDIIPLLKDMCKYIIDFDGEIPGARPEMCGNYLEQNLNMAKYYIKRYLNALESDLHTVYPK